jgi:F-type H+-transporting ATPase subunit delta
MINSGVVKRYTNAFLKEAKDKHLIQRLYTESQTLSNLLAANPALGRVLDSPHIHPNEKIALVDKVFKGRATPLLLNMIKLLTIKYRTDILPFVLELYRQMVDHERGIFEASITTARDLEFMEKLQLKTALEKYTGTKLNIQYIVDKDILGGVIFQYQDLLIDNSIRGQLNKLNKKLSEIDIFKN